MKKKLDKLQPLFIDDLGEVKGGCGGNATTLALGEEADATSMAIGEEDGGWGGGGDVTTLAIGEEDGATTLALGEE